MSHSIDHVKLMSQSIALMSPARVFSAPPKPETKPNLRDSYIRIMEMAQEQISPEDYVRQIFDKVGRELIAQQVKDEKDEKPSDQPFWVVHNDKGYLYKPKNSISYLIGRFPGCFPTFEPNEYKSSRIGAVVFILARYIILVDVGSLNGIKTLKRFSEAKCEETNENNRVLTFGRDERFIVQLGQEIVGFNVPECIVCKDLPRTVKLQCDHDALCFPCYQQIMFQGDSKCPICRQPLDLKFKPQKICMQTFAK